MHDPLERHKALIIRGLGLQDLNLRGQGFDGALAGLTVTLAFV